MYKESARAGVLRIVSVGPLLILRGNFMLDEYAEAARREGASGIDWVIWKRKGRCVAAPLVLAWGWYRKTGSGRLSQLSFVAAVFDPLKNRFFYRKPFWQRAKKFRRK
jgi:hypothetical protein